MFDSEVSNRDVFNDYPLWRRNRNRSRATMSKVVGEIPLNRNGLLLTRYGEDEEIVYSHAKT